MSANRFGPMIAALALALAAPGAVQAGGRVQPGRWEVTATVELPGVASPAPTTQVECLSQQDVDADPAPGLEQGACRVTDVVRSGDRVTWKLDCGPAGKGGGEVVYESPTAYSGWMTLESGGAVVRTTLHARRLGGC